MTDPFVYGTGGRFPAPSLPKHRIVDEAVGRCGCPELHYRIWCACGAPYDGSGLSRSAAKAEALQAFYDHCLRAEGS